jgi:hypothetical protein
VPPHPAAQQSEAVRLNPQIQRSLKNLFTLVDADCSGSMEEDEFRVLNRAMYMALKCFWDESLPELEDAQYHTMATEDWSADCPTGLNEMDWPLFGLSIFQLAHTWTHLEHKANVEACMDFLTSLHEFLCTEEPDGEGGVRQRMATDEEIRVKANAKKDKMRTMLAVIRGCLNPATLQWEMTDELAEILVKPAKDEAIALYGEGNISTVCGESAVTKVARRLSVNSGCAAKVQKNDLDRRKDSFLTLQPGRTTEMVLKFMELHLHQMKDEWSELADEVRAGAVPHARRNSQSARVASSASTPALGGAVAAAARRKSSSAVTGQGLERRGSHSRMDAGAAAAAANGVAEAARAAAKTAGAGARRSSQPSRKVSFSAGQGGGGRAPSPQSSPAANLDKARKLDAELNDIAEISELTEDAAATAAVAAAAMTRMGVGTDGATSTSGKSSAPAGAAPAAGARKSAVTRRSSNSKGPRRKSSVTTKR